MQENAINDSLDTVANIANVSATVLPKGVQQEENGSLSVDISLLVPNPHQPRTEFESESLQELADSIREHGVLQPPTIEDAGNGTFYIIQGERRTRASKLAGLSRIPVILKKYSETDKLEVALIENIQRENLNPVEEAVAYQKLMEMGKLSQEEMAQRVGKKRSTVANALRLLKLPEDMQNALVSGEITAGHARALLSVVNPADQRILFARIIGNGLSVREAEEAATELNNGGRVVTKKKVTKETKKNPDITSIEQQFIDVLGTKVSLKGDLQKGSIVIDYFSSDDLDRLYNIILGK
ncbi:MAG: ParB/RepB/Spo0J family partition protein [Spirochaetaceae bacterium]|nr:ParB/RepB/Spo0J family partition protein [Spirochaetaceae bacterium]